MTATAIAAAESPEAAGPRTTVRSTLAVSVLAALVPALAGLAFLGRYGWHRDELYFLEASHHLAFGYVDFPPLIAVVGRAVVVVFGTSLDALRVTTMVIGLTSVAFVALSARELGGSLRAQALAALAWATAPIALGAASLFHPTWLDLAAQTATLYLVLVAVTRPMPRLWPAVGVMAGIGLEAKYTIATLLLALVAGLALTPQRRVLRTRGPWIAAGIAFVLLLPNIGWEIHHGWPSAAFVHSQRAQTAADTPPPAYVADAVVFLAACTALAVIGGVWMWRRPDLRAFTWAAVFVMVGFGLEQGRGYYPLPAMIVCVAAGAVALERWRPAARWRRRAVLGCAGGVPGAGDRGGGPGCGTGAIDRGHDRQRHLEDLVLQGRDRLAGDGRADGAGVAVAAPGRARPRGDPGPELRRGGCPCPLRPVARPAAAAVGAPQLAVLAARPAPAAGGADRGL